jgi:hypothetical protein
MKRLGLLLIVSTILCAFAADTPDPIKAYLESFSPLGGDARIFTDDQVLRLDVDLNRDGKDEVLVSMARDRNGKQGNVWSVFARGETGFTRVGAVTASTGFYLGPITETNGYGIVIFWPGGGGTGGFVAYLFNGSTITEKPLGAIERNPRTAELEGKGIEIAAKYSLSVSDVLRDRVERFRSEHGIKAPDPASFITRVQTISAADLAKKYGVKIEAITYEQTFASEAQATRLSDTIDAFMALADTTSRPLDQRPDAIAFVAKINSFEPHVIEDVILNRIAAARNGKHLVKFKFLLERITPSLQTSFIARAAAEPVPRQKRNFVRLAPAFWGRDIARFLMDQLEDKRPADSEGNVSYRSSHEVRICDCAFNVLYEQFRETVGVKMGFGPGGGDAIVNDVPMVQRDQWIATLKSALIAKYGADLKIDERR